MVFSVQASIAGTEDSIALPKQCEKEPVQGIDSIQAALGVFLYSSYRLLQATWHHNKGTSFMHLTVPFI